MSDTNRLMSEIVSHRDPVMMPPGATVQEACRVMRDRRIGAIVVSDETRNVLGIVSRGDFRRLEQARLDEENGYWEIL